MLPTQMKSYAVYTLLHASMGLSICVCVVPSEFISLMLEPPPPSTPFSTASGVSCAGGLALPASSSACPCSDLAVDGPVSSSAVPDLLLRVEENGRLAAEQYL